MKNDNDSSEKTSRRQFTKAALTAAVATPIAASMLACDGGKKTAESSPAKNSSECPVEVKEEDGYLQIDYDAEITPEDHIPPMGFDGGGSLTIDSKNKLTEKGGGPYTYEDDVVTVPHDKYGEINGAFVITEYKIKPFLKRVEYNSIQPGAELLLWYQDIDPRNPSGSDETDYKPLPSPLPEPDIRVKGGGGGRVLTITSQRKKFDPSKSHKKNRPHRFRHADGGGPGSHFRIGRWELKRGNTTIVGAQDDDNYQIYLYFEDYT